MTVFKTIRGKLIALFGAGMLLSLGALGYLSYRSALKNLNNAVDATVEARLAGFRETLDYSFEVEMRSEAKAIKNEIKYLIEGSDLSDEEALTLIQDMYKDEEFSRVGETGYVTIFRKDSMDVFAHPWLETGSDLSDFDVAQDALTVDDGFMDYDWAEEDGTIREKAVALEYYEPLDLWIWVTAYYDEMEAVIGYDMFDAVVKRMDTNFLDPFIITADGIITHHAVDQFVGADLTTFLKENGENFTTEDFMSDEIFLYRRMDPDTGEFIENRYIGFKYHSGLNMMVALTHDVDMFMAPMREMARNIMIIVGAFLAFGFVLSFIIAVSIEKSITQVLHKLNNIASGTEKANLADRLNVLSQDEVGQIAMGVNDLMSKLNKDMLNVKGATNQLSESAVKLDDVLTREVRESIHSISANAEVVGRSVSDTTASTEQANATVEEIARNIQNVNNSIDKQVTAIEESASAMEEMSRNIQNVTDTANETRQISNELNQIAVEGGNAVSQAVHSVKEVSEFSNQIIDMLKLITDVANQTNLLAMNASIEAAHAGEAGKGFAIVADEIRRLSENTNKNAGEINDVVSNIVERIELSVELSEKASVGLERILSSSNTVSEKIAGLNTTMEEQNYTSKEILASIQEIVRVTEEIKLAMEEQSRGIDEFTQMIANLRDVAQTNKKAVGEHMQSLNSLIGSVEVIQEISREESVLSTNLEKLLERFILDDHAQMGENETGLQLVE